MVDAKEAVRSGNFSFLPPGQKPPVEKKVAPTVGQDIDKKQGESPQEAAPPANNPPANDQESEIDTDKGKGRKKRQ